MRIVFNYPTIDFLYRGGTSYHREKENGLEGKIQQNNESGRKDYDL